jgi:hypothetical protein
MQAQYVTDTGKYDLARRERAGVRAWIAESGLPLDPAGPAALMIADIARRIDAGLDPAEVAACIVTAIRQNEFYLFTHPNLREQVDLRFAAIQAAIDEVVVK